MSTPAILVPAASAQGSSPSMVYVSFSAEINPNTTESLLAVMANCVAKGVKEVYLMLSTPGGSVMNGMNVYNMLRGMPFALTTHNVGNVDSIGNVIFLAGSKRYACKHSTFMFHGVGFEAPPGARFDESLCRERLTGILSDQRRIGSIIEERTKLPAVKVRRFFREAQTKDSAFAIGCGIVDAIRDVSIPAGSTVVSLVFQR